MAEVDLGDFEVAVRAQLGRAFDGRMELVVEQMKRRTAPGGGFFDDPSGATSESIRYERTDPDNIRGWYYDITVDSPGGFFTNLGEVLTPNLPPMAMRWIHHRTGDVIFATRVDMRRYRNWVRIMAVEELRSVRQL